MKKIPRIDVTPVHAHRGAVAKHPVRQEKPKGVLDLDAADCVYCRLALGEGEGSGDSSEASFDGLCAWHKAHVPRGSA